MRFLAVLALILLAAAGAYVLMRGSSSTSSTAGTQATLPTTTKATTRTTTTAKQNAKVEKRKKSKHKTPLEGVTALDAALVAHPLVVVSVYARSVATDEQAMKEAKAGAARVGAGFVAFNVFDEKIARQLATLLGDNATSSPEVLFFKRGRKLAFTLQGFADSQVVAQAAKNVYPVSEPWVRDANTICGRYSAPLATAQGKIRIADLNTAAGRKQAAAGLDEAAALLNKETKSLSAVRPTRSAAKDYAQIVADLRQVATNIRSEAQALRSNDQATAKATDQKNAALIASASNLATTLQISTCAS
ncbi:MAG TPA: hypothetical protein VII83_00430 [Gaiellaceae bacterium]